MDGWNDFFEELAEKLSEFFGPLFAISAIVGQIVSFIILANANYDIYGITIVLHIVLGVPIGIGIGVGICILVGLILLGVWLAPYVIGIGIGITIIVVILSTLFFER